MQTIFKRTRSLLLAVIMAAILFSALSLTVSAAEGEPVKFEGMSVSLDNVIKINFVISTTDPDNHDFSLNNIWQLDCDNSREHFRTGMNANDTEEEWTDDGTACKYSFEIYAKELADRFLIQYQYDDGNKTVDCEEVICAKDYLETLAQNAEAYDTKGNPEGLRKLCYATLNYGAAAQKQFGHYGSITWPTMCSYDVERLSSYKRDNLPLANEFVPASYQTDAVPADLGYDSGSQADFSDFHMTYYASSLGLYGDIRYAVCFETDDSYRASFYQYDSASAEWIEPNEFRQIGTVYYGEPDEYGNYEKQADLTAYTITGISANKILDDFRVKFCADVWDEEKEESVFVEKEYTFGPRTYISRVINGTGANPTYTDQEQREGEIYNTGESQSKDELVNTVKTIYDYAVKAKAYFG